MGWENYEMTDEDRAAGLTLDQARQRTKDRSEDAGSYLVVYDRDGTAVGHGPGIDTPLLPSIADDPDGTETFEGTSTGSDYDPTEEE